MALNLEYFRQELLRLRREKWANPTMLAEELYAVLNQLLEDTEGAQGLANPANDPVATVNPVNTDDGSQAIQFTDPNGDPAGGIVLKDGTMNFVPSGKIPKTGPVSSQKPGQGGGVPGQVQSGTGDTYTVTIYPDGTSKAGKNVTVRQLQIDPSATIPAGTWTLVTQTTDGTYYMQVPVWM